MKLHQGGDEATAILSAASSAASETVLPYPILIPIHDPIRDAYEGFITLPPSPPSPSLPSCHASSEWRKGRRQATGARLISDGIRLGSVPTSHSLIGRGVGPEGHLELFASQLSGVDEEGEMTCRSIISQTDGEGEASTSVTSGTHSSVLLSARYSYRMPRPPLSPPPRRRPLPVDSRHQEEEEGGEEEGGWDAGAAWRPWATFSDPIGSIEIDLAWHGVDLSSPSFLPSVSKQSRVVDGDREEEGEEEKKEGGRVWHSILRPSESSHWSIHVLKSSEGCWTRRAKGGLLSLTPSLSSSASEGRGGGRQREYVTVLEVHNNNNSSGYGNRWQSQARGGLRVAEEQNPHSLAMGSTVTTALPSDSEPYQKEGGAGGARADDALELDHSFTTMLSALACAAEGVNMTLDSHTLTLSQSHTYPFTLPLPCWSQNSALRSSSAHPTYLAYPSTPRPLPCPSRVLPL